MSQYSMRQIPDLVILNYGYAVMGSLKYRDTGLLRIRIDWDKFIRALWSNK